MSDMAMKYEDWLRGCVHHDGRKGNVYLPCDTVLAIADWIEAHRDVAPVRHGWWDTSEDNRIVCSECTNGAPYMYKINDKLIMQELTYYCPYCGAIMDGGDDDEKRQV